MDLEISDCDIKVQAGVATGIRLLNAVTGLHINGCTIRNALYGIYADGSSIFTEFSNTFSNCSNKIGLSGSASYWGSTWQGWPASSLTFTSNIGDETATFNGAVNVTKARIKREANTVTALVNFSGTLKSVTPNKILLATPLWAAPLDANERVPCIISQAGTFETGIVETDASGSGKIAFFRANKANFASASAISGGVALVWEVT